MLSTISSKQAKIQESQYIFPYHYLSLHDELYRRFIHKHYLSLLELVRELSDIKPGEHILDAGCGDGRFCYEIRNDNANVIGIDYSERAIAFAQAFAPECTFRCADLTTCYTRPFDKVVNIEVMEHIPPQELNNFAKSLSGCVKFGGVLVISVPSCNIPVTRKHYQHFTPEDLINIFRPWCELLEIKGHIRANQWLPWMRRVSLVRNIWYFKHRIPFANYLMKSIEMKFEKIRLCSAEDSANIVAVFRRNKEQL